MSEADNSKPSRIALLGVPIEIGASQPGPLMGIWLTTVDAQANWPIVLDLLRSEQFKGNDLSISAQIYISQRDTDELENCTLVFPQ